MSRIQEVEKMADTLNFGCLNDLTGFHLALAQIAVYRDFCRSLAPLEITQKQFAVLEMIFQNSDVSQIDIAQALGTDRATMMALVDRLDQRGFIERRQSPHDKRRQELRLTPAGIEIRNIAKDLIHEHEKALFSPLSVKEMVALVGSLRKIYST
ncbi:MarR family transcriptional regulator [Mesorhizobium sp. B2-8-3]|nr:MarR family transcriptional regulator [Mesorhizobium sp. B2-8-3]TPJ36492.1 MarR family transcriptional regulator [Mesorhizobium sp. B2-8-3]